MTKLLKKALERLDGLPDNEQDAIAGIILDEIKDEAHWRASFAASQDALAHLAAGAKKEIAEGKAEPYDPATKPE